MLLNFGTHKFMALFVVIFTSMVGLIIDRTPTLIPEGFPYTAKTLDSDQLIQKKKSANVVFVDRTLEKGLNFMHQQGDDQLAGIDESLSSGACAADFNNDGWVDLYLVNGSGHTRYYGKPYWWQSSQGNALFLNIRGEGFKDATSASGLAKKIWGMGCLTGDFDNDGDVDLLVTGKDTLLLYKNNGNGMFADVSRESGIAGKYWSTSAAAADFNRDGLLDLYIGNFIDFNKGKKTFEANSRFAGENTAAFDSGLYEAQANQLYLNLGGLKFQEMAAQAGVMDLGGKTLDVSWQDLNQDSLPDLLVSNDRGTGSNRSFLNKNGAFFAPGGQALGLHSALGSRGIASGDLDNDGDSDLVVASAAGEGTLALIEEPSVDGKVEYKDRARAMGVAANPFLNLSAWSTLIQDFNNDGFNDIFIAAGHLEPDPDVAKVSQGQPKQLLLNTGNGHFTDAGTSAGIALQDAQSARGSVSADFDNDGDVDLYVVHNNDLGQYLVNESPKRHWFGLKLIGTKSNRDGIGAIVRLTTPKGRQMKTVVSGEGFLSDSDKKIVFGLGDATDVEKIMIHWPSGHQQTLHSVQADRYWQVEENRDDPQELPGTVAVNASSRKLRLKLGVDQAEIRTRYVRMLDAFQDIDKVGSELAIAAKDNNASVRREVIAVASRLHSMQGLIWLIHGLEDVETANVIAAIEGLRLYEDETSVRWLLRLFSHQGSAVKIAVADCFAFFFQEEEAVVHRKYLAVPYLIRLLDDPEPKVRIAAARALASAERFRGVHALLDHLDDPDPATRAELVRSLGLIRQAQALPDLQRLISDGIQPVHVIANSFIARKRLGDESALKSLIAFVMGQEVFSAVPLEKRLDVFADLLAQDNEVAVFDSEQLKQLAHAAFDKFPPAAKDLDLTRRWIRVRQHITDQADTDWLARQTHATQSTIRTLAFSAVFLQRRAEPSSFLRRAWSDQEPAIKQWALKELLSEKVALSMDDYQKILADPTLRLLALQFWSKTLLSTEPSMLLNALKLERENKYSGGQSAKEAAVQQISKLPKNGQPSELEALCFNTDADWQAFCPLILFSNNTSEHRSMAVKLLRDPKYPIAIRQTVLNHYGNDFDPDAVNVVYAVAQVKKDPLRDAAINKLFSFKSEALIEFADKTARDVSEISDIRFQALEFLMRQGHPDAREILYR